MVSPNTSKSRGVSDMTPFEAAGYTKDTVFRVTKWVPKPLVGARVALWVDDGTDMPCFTDGSALCFVKLYNLEYVSGPRNREEPTTPVNDTCEASELRARFSEHAPTKFKQGDMVLYRGGLRMVVAVNVNNAQYTVSHDSGWDVAREEELTRYEESRK